VWGNNITVCNLHLTKIIREARSRGAKLVVVDPKRIRIAEESDLHLPLTPGTDVVLAYAVATLLESQGQLDSEFIARHVEGAEAFLAEARKYPLQEAARLCGLEVDDIARFASWWGELSPAAISMGVAPERNRNGGAGIRAAFALPALTGNIGFPGAGVCDVSGYFPIEWDALKRPDLIPEGTRKFSVLDIADKILDPGDELPIKSVFIYNHNPVAVHPDQQNMRKALMQEDLFVVGSDISMTDSMALADIILPATTHLEYGDLYKSYGHHYLQRSEAVIPPVGEALPNTELFRRLAARFDFEESCFADTDADLVDQAVAASSPGMNNRSPMQHFVDEAVDMSVGNKESLLRDAPPATPSSKIELYSTSLEESCGEGLPHFKPMSSDRRFIVISPSSDKRTNSTFGGVTGHDEDMVVEMNPADAASLSLAEGERVRLFNEQGDVVLPLVLNLGVRESVLYVPKGAWLKSSLTGHTVNALIPSHRADLAGGACYNDCRVDVETYAS
jgi:anaerobic selenocysteine-containing dehydrogenase